MVTLRRDIAAEQKMGAYNARRTGALTNYDSYIAKESIASNNAQKSYDEVYQSYDTEVEANQPKNYKEYIYQKLENNSKESLMSEEEFNKKYNLKTKAKIVIDVAKINKQEKQQKKSARATVSTRSGQLSKKGKFFIALYVLMVAIVASIIIAVNTAVTPSRVDADSIANAVVSQSIKPLSIEKEGDLDTNWFDKLCDSLNK